MILEYPGVFFLGLSNKAILPACGAASGSRLQHQSYSLFLPCYGGALFFFDSFLILFVSFCPFDDVFQHRPAVFCDVALSLQPPHCLTKANHPLFFYWMQDMGPPIAGVQSCPLCVMESSNGAQTQPLSMTFQCILKAFLWLQIC